MAADAPPEPKWFQVRVAANFVPESNLELAVNTGEEMVARYYSRGGNWMLCYRIGTNDHGIVPTTFLDLGPETVSPLPKVEEKKKTGLGRLFGSRKATPTNLTANLDPLPERNPSIVQTKIFGESLAEGTRRRARNASPKAPLGMPVIIHDCLDFLQHHLKEEGIFRLSGNSNEIQDYKDAYNRGEAVNLYGDGTSFKDPHVVAGLLKQYFRELPSSEVIMPNHVATTIEENGLTEGAAEYIYNNLPPTNLLVLRSLTQLVGAVASFSKVNKMTCSNLAIVFAPTLRISQTVCVMMFKDPAFFFPWEVKFDNMLPPPSDGSGGGGGSAGSTPDGPSPNPSPVASPSQRKLSLAGNNGGGGSPAQRKMSLSGQQQGDGSADPGPQSPTGNKVTPPWQRESVRKSSVVADHYQQHQQQHEQQQQQQQQQHQQQQHQHQQQQQQFLQQEQSSGAGKGDPLETSDPGGRSNSRASSRAPSRANSDDEGGSEQASLERSGGGSGDHRHPPPSPSRSLPPSRDGSTSNFFSGNDEFHMSSGGGGGGGGGSGVSESNGASGGGGGEDEGQDFPSEPVLPPRRSAASSSNPFLNTAAQASPRPAPRRTMTVQPTTEVSMSDGSPASSGPPDRKPPPPPTSAPPRRSSTANGGGGGSSSNPPLPSQYQPPPSSGLSRPSQPAEPEGEQGGGEEEWE